MIAFMPGLIAGLGKYYKDSPQTRLVANQVHIMFS